MSPRVARTAAAFAVALSMGCGGSSGRKILNPTPAPPTPLTRAKIAFLSGRDGQPDLYLLDPVDSTVTRVTNDAALEQYPVISPDSSWIAFMEMVDTHFDVFVVGVDGSNLKNLTNDATSNNGPPRWSADGSKIYFTKGQIAAPHSTDIYEIGRNGGAEAPVTRDGATILLDARRDGGALLAMRGDGLWTMKPDGSSQALIDTIAVFAAEFSPTGTRIAYGATSISGAKDIYVMNANATGRVNVTNGSFDGSWSPTWSPDESRIVFQGADNGQPAELRIIKTDGTGLLPVTTGPSSNGEPYWGPK